MSKKSLAILMRARMRGAPNEPHGHRPQQISRSAPNPSRDRSHSSNLADSNGISAKDVKEWMQASISIPAGSRDPADAYLEEFSQGYLMLSQEGRRELLLALSRDYDVNRARVRELMRQYLSLELSHGATDDQQSSGLDDDGALSTFYRMERNLRDALKPMYAEFFERLNAHPGGLKLLAILRADLLVFLGEENLPSLRALDSYLKEKLITWLSPAALELHQITWDDSASLLEKIVAYEVRGCPPNKKSNRLEEKAECWSSLLWIFPSGNPSAQLGEPLIFIEVALLKDVACSIQEVLWDDPPIPECEARCALFYSISSTQPGLSGINLGKFLLKRVIDMLRKDVPSIAIFATLSPIPGFMQWLLSKLASQIKLAEAETEEAKLLDMGSGSAFRESLLLQDEEKIILESFTENVTGKSGIEIMHYLLQSSEWVKSECLSAALKPPLMRLCARYLHKEKKRGKALDAVANFHLQNGAIVERINWMADQSEKGIRQSGGIMVNYVYRLEEIDKNAQSYLSTGHIHASPRLC
ncbi:malonyl-CoA decarboxylase, mitochondrial isoform X2 [Ananas comosus]|uniref:Malonyl-CoA decarboxylase, mitochondrial isoform X2 n=1 Tax=Ananas comosus TaxID=4615 RepID=A0A6P5H4L0_ANACO|nr:malonyl-CoA decarboxylase, mitochondrial isoform X2 [Ananas comosus]